MTQRTLPPNGLLIRSLREARGLTIEQAAAQAGYAARTWRRRELGEPAFRKTIEDVAALLEVDPEVITLDPSFGPRSEIDMFGLKGVGSALLSINSSQLKASAAEIMYGLAVLLDMCGEADSAAALCESLAAITPNPKQRAAALIRLAAINEHRNIAERVLKILDKLEKELKAQSPPDLNLLNWGRYQAGVLRLAVNRIDEAEETLEDVAHNAPAAEQRISARHQLGIVALRRGNYSEARRLFNACLCERPASSFRRAFDYRRIGEASALDVRKGEAITALKAGIRVAQRAGFERYVQEILKTASRLGP